MKRNIFIAFLLLGLVLPFSLSAQSGKKKKKDYLFTVSTQFGEIKFLLFDETPGHKANFYKMTEEKVLDSTLFHRVMKNFMIQGGDPFTKPGAVGKAADVTTDDNSIPAEIVPGLTHLKGSIAAARMPDQINPEKRSSKTQFYIVHSEKGTKHLNGGYSVFGIVIEGIEVVDEIANQPVARGNKPVSDIYMTVTVEELKRKKINKIYGYVYPGTEEKEKKKKSKKEKK